MTHASNQIVTATCPGCNQSLRIPAAWVGQMMRCKHCSMHFQAKAPAGDQPKKKRRRNRDLLLRATRLVMDAIPRRKRRKKRKRGLDVPQSKPYAPPPAIPLGQAPPAGKLPAAIPLPSGQACAPEAIPVGGPPSSKLPKAVPMPAGGLGFDLPPSRRRRRSRAQKIALVVISFIAVGGLFATFALVARKADKTELAVSPFPKMTTSPTVVTRVPATGPPAKAADNPGMAAGTNPTAKDRPPLPPSGKAPGPPTGTATRPPTPVGPSVTIPTDVRGNFPRRLLAIVPVNYAFASPVGPAGNSPRSIPMVVSQFADLLRIPQDQVVLLSDAPPIRKPPIKAMIEDNVKRYLQNCRPQDRIVLLFVGHGVEVGDKPYLLPLEGEKENVNSLLALDWFYQELARCPARQKVFIVDACRSNPYLGGQLGDVEKMGAKFDAMLAAPPAGVQVLTACTAGQHSLEVPVTSGGPDGDYEGGIMLGQVPVIKLHGGLRGVIQRPEDPIPIQPLATILTTRTGAFAKRILRDFKVEQTVRLCGAEPPGKVAYDPKFPAAAPFEIKLAGDFVQGVATREQLESILEDTRDIPPTRRGDNQVTLNFDSLPPYALKVLADYKKDSADSPLRDKVRAAIAALKANNQALQETFVKNFANQQQENLFKTSLENIQKPTGVIIFTLETMLDDLDALQNDKEKESKRWQANFEYVRARLAARIAYVFEYNAMLGAMRKEFPPMDPELHRGWQLASKAKMSDRDAEKFVKRAQKYLDALAKGNIGTPWELIAKREKVTALGLDWKPLNK